MNESGEGLQSTVKLQTNFTVIGAKPAILEYDPKICKQTRMEMKICVIHIQNSSEQKKSK